MIHCVLLPLNPVMIIVFRVSPLIFGGTSWSDRTDTKGATDIKGNWKAGKNCAAFGSIIDLTPYLLPYVLARSVPKYVGLHSRGLHVQRRIRSSLSLRWLVNRNCALAKLAHTNLWSSYIWISYSLTKWRFSGSSICHIGPPNYVDYWAQNGVRMINILWARNPISFRHMSFWCTFFDSHLSSNHIHRSIL